MAIETALDESKPSKRRGRPHLEEAAVIRLAILSAARALFFEHGFAAVSAEAVAHAAGISKRTLYTRFGNKSEIFEAVILTEIETNIAAIEAELPRYTEIRASLNMLAMRLLAWLLTDRNVAMERAVLAEAARFPELARNIHDSGSQRAAALVEGVLATARQLGEVAIADIGFAAEHFVSVTIIAPMHRAALGLGPRTLDAAAKSNMRRSVDLFLDGCGVATRQSGHDS